MTAPAGRAGASGDVLRRPAAGENDGADQGGEQDDGDDLEGQHPGAEQGGADSPRAPDVALPDVDPGVAEAGSERDDEHGTRGQSRQRRDAAVGAVEVG